MSLKKNPTEDDSDVSILLFEEYEADIIKELNVKIDTNEFGLKFYLSCANYFIAMLYSFNGSFIEYDMTDPEIFEPFIRRVLWISKIL